MLLLLLALTIPAAAQNLDWVEAIGPLDEHEFSDVAVDPKGRFLAVGQSGLIASSYDGHNWVRRTPLTTQNLQRVLVTNEGVYVAGTRGVVLFSTDGDVFSVTRAEDSVGSPDSCAGLAADGSRIVMVLATGVVYRSEDGVNWEKGHLNAADTSLNIGEVVFGGGRFVAVGNTISGREAVYSSSDGLNWRSRAEPSIFDHNQFANSFRLNQVIYANGRFWAAGQSSLVASSVDGETWTSHRGNTETGAGSVRGLASIGGRFFASSDTGIRVSNDGQLWEPWDESGTAPNFALLQFAQRNGVLLGVGRFVTKRNVLGSWKPLNNLSGPQVGELAGGDGWIVGNLLDSGIVATRDGLNWEQRTILGTETVDAVGFGGGKFLAVASGSKTALWDPASDSVAVADIMTAVLDVAYGLSTWVGATGANDVLVSSDGIAWASGHDTAGSSVTHVAFGSGRFVGIGSSVVLSEDGKNWRTPTQTAPVNNVAALAFGGGKFVALGSSGLRGWYSENGDVWNSINWSGVSLPSSSFFHFKSLSYANGRFLAYGRSGVFSSLDGVSWTLQDEIFTAGGFRSPDLYDFGFADNRWVAVGNLGRVYVSPVEGISKLPVLSPEQSLVRTGTVGEALELSVAASGDGLTYQWYAGEQGDWSTPVAGATGSILTASVPAVAEPYWVRVSNQYGSIHSETFFVAVGTGVRVNPTESWVEARVGLSVPLTVSVSGLPLPELQWYRGPSGDTSQPIAEATDTSLSVTVSALGVEKFWVRADNGDEIVHSTAITVVPWEVSEQRPNFSSMVPSENGWLGVQGDKISRSSNGITWELAAEVRQGGFYDIAYLGTRAIAVGDGGIHTSDDGEQWTHRPGVSRVLRIATGGGMAVAALPDLHYSSDGVTWLPVSIPSNVTLWDVAYHGGGFVAVGGELPEGQSSETEVIYRSEDGVSWSRSEFSGKLPTPESGYATQLNRVEVYGSEFFAICQNIPRFYRSVDGISWIGHEMGDEIPGLVNHAARVGERLVVLGASVLATSLNGVDWQVQEGLGNEGVLIEIDGSLRWYAQDYRAYESADGRDWALIDSAPDIRRIAAGAGRFLATESSPEGIVYWSEDGRVWRQQQEVKLPGQRHLYYANGEFVLGESTPFRTDGNEPWIEVIEIPNDPGGESVATLGDQFVRLPGGTTQMVAGNGVFVASGRGIWFSSDAKNWTEVPGYEFKYGRVFFDSQHFIATDYSATFGQHFLTSTDGSNWVQQDAPDITESSGIDFLDYLGGRYYLGSGQFLWTSLDLDKWSRIEGVPAPALGVYANGNVLLYDNSRNHSRRLWDGESLRVLAYPEDRVADIGSTGTLTISVEGESPQVQWYQGKTGNISSPVAGANNTTLAVTFTEQEQNYWVQINAENFEEDSPTVRVSSDGAPRILQQPRPFSTNRDSDYVTLSLKVSGVDPLSFQWFEGNTGETTRPVVGATGSSYTFPISGSASRYWVRVSNSHGRIDSISVPVEQRESRSFGDGSDFISMGAAAFGEGRFVVSGRVGPFSSTAVPTIAASNDGRQWTFHDVEKRYGGMAYGSGRFVAYDFAAESVLFSSIDGISWTPVSPSVAGSFQWLRREQDHFLAASATGDLHWSSDGLSWSHNNAFGVAWSHVVQLGEFYWGVLTDGRLMRSADLVNWAPQILADGLGMPQSIVALQGDLLVFDDNYRAFRFSKTGEWSLTPFVDGRLPKMSSTASQARETEQRVSVGYPYHLALTEDGIHWWNAGGSGDSYVLGTESSIIVGGSSAYVFTNYASPDVVAPERKRFCLPEIQFDARKVFATAGQPLELTVSVIGDAVSFQWRRNGVDIAGATGSTLRIVAPKFTDVGSYDVVVRNGRGSITSPAVEVKINDSSITPAVGVQSTQKRRYSPGESIEISNTISLDGELDSFTWSLMFPDSWVVSNSATNGGPSMVVSSGLTEWTWTAPASSINFDYFVTVPAEPGNVLRLAGLLTSSRSGIEVLSLATPDPLVLRAGSSIHSADVDSDSKLSLGELLRVIELYNTRFGTSRTGRYGLTDNSSDGFDPNPDGNGGVLARYHSADFDSDGMFSLSELLRVIELYNSRSGTTRTGAYRMMNGTPDGFEPEGE